MNIEEIRRNFNKASIAISASRLLVIYMREYFYQSVESGFLSELIERSFGFTIESNDRSCVKLCFQVDTGEIGNVIYPCVSEELSIEDIKRICDESKGVGISIDDYLPDNPTEVDISDLMECAHDFVLDRDEREPDIHTDHQKWSELLNHATMFATAIGAEYEVINPGRKNPGIITIYVLESRKSVKITGYAKRLAMLAVRESMDISFEIDASEGTLYILFGSISQEIN